VALKGLLMSTTILLAPMRAPNTMFHKNGIGHWNFALSTTDMKA
jgi:hypothetical protein